MNRWCRCPAWSSATVGRPDVAKAGKKGRSLAAVQRDVARAQAAHAKGDISTAMRLLKEVLSRNARNAEALVLLAHCFFDQRRPEAAAKLLHEALNLQPRHLPTYALLAASYRAAGQVGAALQVSQQALEIDPYDLDTLRHQAMAALDLKRIELAEASAEAIQARVPGDYDALFVLAQSRYLAGDLDGARREANRLLKAHPRTLAGWRILANVETQSGNGQGAIKALRHALSMQDQPDAWQQLLLAQHVNGEWTSIDETRRRMEAGVRAHLAGRVTMRADPMNLLNVSNDGELMKRAFMDVGRRIWRSRSLARDALAKLPRVARQPGERLRIAYLSSNFRNHPLATATRSIFQHHDRERFEVFVYATRPDDSSDDRKAIASSVEHFVELFPFTEEEAARRIIDDGIHVLVDPDGHSSNADIGVLALRPAPVQCHWLGTPFTWGSREVIDYVLADPVILLREHERLYVEKVARLPRCYFPCNEHLPRVAEEIEVTRGDVGLPSDAFVFASFCRTFKLNPETFDDWAKILERTTGSVLWLSARDDFARDNLRREMVRRGIDGERIVFAPQARDHSFHIARQAAADLSLNNLPYGAHSTTMDSLAAGTPVLTVTGPLFPGRAASSMLLDIGLPELVCDTREDYIDRAVDLASKPERLTAIRERLRAKMAAGPLAERNRQFARALEDAFETMWRRHEAGEPPASFDVARVKPSP
ncbi:MAG: tetratricopeptide repeat protein [Pseudomonadota bacterium]